MMKYYVKGGKNSHGKHGYIVSNANWDPYPMANKLEDFVIALANMDIAVSLRIDRFSNPFFTSTDPAKALNLPPGSDFAVYLAGGGGYTPVDLQQEIQSLTNPVAPSGAAIVGTVEDLQAQTRIKAYRVRAGREHDLRPARARSIERGFLAGRAQGARCLEEFRRRPHRGLDGVSQNRAAAAGHGRQPHAAAAHDRHRVPQGTPAANFYTAARRRPPHRKSNRVRRDAPAAAGARPAWSWALGAMLAAGAARAQAAYRPIAPTRAGEVDRLTGHDLTVDQVVAIARDGAQIRLSPEAKQRQADAYGLLLEGSAEGISIYGFNRGAGAGARDRTVQRRSARGGEQSIAVQAGGEAIQNGPRQGIGPEVADEEIVRALMAVRANTMIYEAASPALSAMLIEMLNRRVTPVVQSRGSLGEADLAAMANVLGAMGGAGDAYYQGRRMSAAAALAAAGLKPLQPVRGRLPLGIDQHQCLIRSGKPRCWCTMRKLTLDWADLILAMDLEAMNSSVTPLTTPVQANRPFKYSNLEAARVLDMIKGSYLFEDDAEANHSRLGEPARIVQPAGRGVEGLGDAARYPADADQLLRPQSRGESRAHRPRTPGSSIRRRCEVLREGRSREPRPARLHPLQCQLGPLSVGE